jgi:glycosyltransferase involved in cell wall biosynthesis
MTLTLARRFALCLRALADWKLMRILIISNLFPPYIMGGAEMAAHSLAVWLAGAGHEVRVLTTAPERSVEGTETLAPGLAVTRRYFENVYQVYRAPRNSLARKAVWHFKDHFHPDSERIAREIIDDFQPDVVNTHDLQGIGYNLLKAIGDRGLPCVQVLHDFGFICLSMNMFRHGRECSHHHLACQGSAAIKRGFFGHIKALSFVSPSAALLERYRPHLPHHLEACVIPLPLYFAPAPRRPARAPGNGGGPLRLLYVGQIEPWKGIDFLCEILAPLAQRGGRFHLQVVGGGGLLAGLQARFAGADWITLTGKVAAAEVGAHMAASDLLVVPSVWFENAPLVISQALRLGLPVLASRVGGLPEMVDAGVSGDLVAPGDAAAWTARIETLLREPGIVARWRAGARDLQETGSPEVLGPRMVEVFQRTAGHAMMRQAEKAPA